MKTLSIIGFVGLGTSIAAASPGTFSNLYAAILPTTAAMRQALDECFLSDYHFNRFDAAQRDSCYRVRVPTIKPEIAAPTGPIGPQNENAIDLRRVAAAGSMPQNDIRFEQNTERYAHATGISIQGR